MPTNFDDEVTRYGAERAIERAERQRAEIRLAQMTANINDIAWLEAQMKRVMTTPVVVQVDDDLEDFEDEDFEEKTYEEMLAERSDEEMDAATSFSWIVKFTVSGTWVADGFNLTSERACEMIASELSCSREGETNAEILASPPKDAIAKIQGETVTPPY